MSTYEEFRENLPVFVDIVKYMKVLRGYNYSKVRDFTLNEFFSVRIDSYNEKVNIKNLFGSDLFTIMKDTQTPDPDHKIQLAMSGDIDVYFSSREHPAYELIYRTEFNEKFDLLNPETKEEELFQYSTAGYSDKVLLILELEVLLQEVLDPSFYCDMCLLYNTDWHYSNEQYKELRDKLKGIEHGKFK